MDKLHGILFDYSGTVVSGDGFHAEDGFHAVCDCCDLPESVSAERVVEFFVNLELGFQEKRNQTDLEISFTKILKIVIDYFGLKSKMSLRELESTYYSNTLHYQPTPGIANFLRRISESGCKAAILSNSIHSEELISGQLSECGLSRFFDIIISSEDYGIRKQNPLLFDLALSRLGLNKSEVVFTGDNLEYDIATGQKAGLKSLWYNSKGKDSEVVEPDFSFSEWDSVSPAVFERVLLR